MDAPARERRALSVWRSKFATRQSSRAGSRRNEFDRTTGVENVDNNPVVIDSVAPLPGDIRDILLGLDRKYREAEYRRAEDPNWRLPEDEAKLTKDEIRALLFVGKLHENYPI